MMDPGLVFRHCSQDRFDRCFSLGKCVTVNGCGHAIRAFGSEVEFAGTPLEILVYSVHCMQIEHKSPLNSLISR